MLSLLEILLVGAACVGAWFLFQSARSVRSTLWGLFVGCLWAIPVLFAALFLISKAGDALRSAPTPETPDLITSLTDTYRARPLPEVDPSMPVWLNGSVFPPGELNGDARFVTHEPIADPNAPLVRVSSGLYASREEADTQTLEQLRKLVRQHLVPERSVPINHGTITPLIRDRYVTASVHGDVNRFTAHQVHLLVELSPQFRHDLWPKIRSRAVTRHLGVLTISFAFLVLMAATVSGYLHLNDRTEGEMRNRLRLAAATLLSAIGLLGGGIIDEHLRPPGPASPSAQTDTLMNSGDSDDEQPHPRPVAHNTTGFRVAETE